MKQTITIEVTDEEYNAFRSALLLQKSHPAFENQLDYAFDAEVVAVRSLFDKVMIARQTQVGGRNVDAKKCHSCMRPFKKLTNKQRARTNVGTGHEKEVAKSLSDMGNACRKVHELLKEHRLLAREGRGLFDGWVSEMNYLKNSMVVTALDELGNCETSSLSRLKYRCELPLTVADKHITGLRERSCVNPTMQL